MAAMERSALPGAVARLVAEIAAEPAVDRVVLFGSRAKGTDRPRSDVDLAVEAPGASVRTWSRLLELAEEAETLLAIDLIRLDTANAEFRNEILREGVTLYARPNERQA
jgi:uncharacterized protein